MSTAFHPQTDGQSEAVNKTIAMYLRCITGDRPRAWLDWLPWAEYVYNTAYHTALRSSPFQVVYGRPPPTLLPYTPSTASTTTVDTLLQDRDAFIADVRERLLQAQQHAKRHYDNNHKPLEFTVNDWVWLRLLNRNTHSLLQGTKTKLSPRYAGPYQVLERIGQVAYKLRLPASARIHDVFHVGLLKPFHGTPPVSTPPLPPLQDGRMLQQPVKILKSQLRRSVWHVLVHWSGLPKAEATWEPVPSFKDTYSEFQLEDELFPEGRRDVMTGNVYERRRTATN